MTRLAHGPAGGILLWATLRLATCGLHPIPESGFGHSCYRLKVLKSLAVCRKWALNKCGWDRLPVIFVQNLHKIRTLYFLFAILLWYFIPAKYNYSYPVCSIHWLPCSNLVWSVPLVTQDQLPEHTFGCVSSVESCVCEQDFRGRFNISLQYLGPLLSRENFSQLIFFF